MSPEYKLTMERVHPSMVNPLVMLDIWRGRTEMYPFKPNSTYQVWMEHKQRYAFAKQLLSSGTVLDLACGTGYGKQVLGENFEYTGFDISPTALKEAVTINNGGGYINGNARVSLPFAKESFGNIVCFETIEHIPFSIVPQLLSEFKRVTKPNGTILISTPNRDVYNPQKSINDRPKNKFHYYEFDHTELSESLESSFGIVKSITIFGQGSVHIKDLSNPASNGARLRRLKALLNGSYANIYPLENQPKNQVARFFLAKIVV
jgi:SAM-dependent methyltransferase